MYVSWGSAKYPTLRRSEGQSAEMPEARSAAARRRDAEQPSGYLTEEGERGSGGKKYVHIRKRKQRTFNRQKDGLGKAMCL